MISTHEMQQETTHHALWPLGSESLWPLGSESVVQAGSLGYQSTQHGGWSGALQTECSPKGLGNKRTMLWRTHDPSRVLSLWKSPDGSVILRRWSVNDHEEHSLYCGDMENHQWSASWNTPHYFEVAGDLIIRDLDTGREMKRFLAPKGFQWEQVVAVCRPDQVGVYLENQTYAYFALWNIDSGKEEQHIPIFRVHRRNRVQTLQSLQVSSAGKILVAQQGRVLSCWNLDSGQSMSHVIHHADLVGVVCADNVPMLATLSRKSVSVWSGLDQNRLIHRMNLSGECSAVAFSWDGQLVAIGEPSGKIRVWNTTTLSCGQTWQAPTAVDHLLFSQDGTHVLSSHADGTLQSWAMM